MRDDDWESNCTEYLAGTGEEPGAFDKEMTETEIAWVADQRLRTQSWETYPEVVLETFAGRPDLIATRRGICQVFECKRTLTLGVIEQASRWRTHSRPEQAGMPHLIWVACKRPQYRSNNLLWWLLREFDIGLMSIEKQPAVETRFGSEIQGAGSRHGLLKSFNLARSLILLDNCCVPRCQLTVISWSLWALFESEPKALSPGERAHPFARLSCTTLACMRVPGSLFFRSTGRRPSLQAHFGRPARHLPWGGDSLAGWT